jgi:hypothetical protein
MKYEYVMLGIVTLFLAALAYFEHKRGRKW